jgi:dynein heavy chain, axonemal
VFGGSTQQPDATQSEYSNDVVVMDACGDDTPIKSTLTKGDRPPPRMSSAVAYDVRGSRIIVSSGWANQWYDDTKTLYTLNVGRIVGPPYTVNALEPKVGPVTGGILVRIEGVDFVNKLPIVVRFATRRQFVDAEGEFVNDGELLCTLPSFEKCGPSDVQVRVSIKGDSFTTTYQKFSFFQVTDHSKCTAFGPGLIDGGTAGFTTLFHIVAVDKDGKIRTSGGDEFDIHIAKPDGGALPYKIQDNENGDYVVAFEPKDSGPCVMFFFSLSSFQHVSSQQQQQLQQLRNLRFVQRNISRN